MTRPWNACNAARLLVSSGEDTIAVAVVVYSVMRVRRHECYYHFQILCETQKLQEVGTKVATLSVCVEIAKQS